VVNLDYEEYVREQVSEKDWEILQELKVNLDTRILASLWADFVNFEKRRKSEIPFLVEQLKEHSNPKVFDSCLGSGPTTIGLKLVGIKDIISNEIDIDLIKVALREAIKYGISLKITQYDWRKLNEKLTGKFDVVINLGNSLTYLFKRKDQLKTLKNFWRILKPNGILIIDVRNYEQHFLKKGKYKYSGNVVYCGKETVHAHPVFVSPTMVVMEYRHKNTGKVAHLVLYPFEIKELILLFKEAGFKNVKVYGDYRREFDRKEPEFLTFVCKKTK